MKVWVVTRKEVYGRYDEMDADLTILLITRDEAKAQHLMETAKLLGVGDTVILSECEVE